MDLVLTPEQFLELEPRKRLLAVRDQLDLTPERYDQRSWWRNQFVSLGEACGTAYCVGGWTCALAGDIFVDGETLRTSDGSEVWVRDRAAELLDLDAATANHLFAAGNPRAEVDRLVDLFVADPDKWRRAP